MEEEKGQVGGWEGRDKSRCVCSGCWLPVAWCGWGWGWVVLIVGASVATYLRARIWVDSSFCGTKPKCWFGLKWKGEGEGEGEGEGGGRCDGGWLVNLKKAVGHSAAGSLGWWPCTPCPGLPSLLQPKIHSWWSLLGPPDLHPGANEGVMQERHATETHRANTGLTDGAMQERYCTEPTRAWQIESCRSHVPPRHTGPHG